VLRSDSSALARDCRAEAKAISQQLLKLEPWKRAERRQLQVRARPTAVAATTTRSGPGPQQWLQPRTNRVLISACGSCCCSSGSSVRAEPASVSAGVST